MNTTTEPPLIPEEGVPQYSVVQFFEDGNYEYVARNVLAQHAMILAAEYTRSVAAQSGLTARVIITDAGDDCVFEWKFGEGVVWPPSMVGMK
jgi:hypothetical protein